MLEIYTEEQLCDKAFTALQAISERLDPRLGRRHFSSDVDKAAIKTLKLDDRFSYSCEFYANRDGLSVIEYDAVLISTSLRLNLSNRRSGSKPEMLIEALLISYGIEFEREKTFLGMSHFGMLRLDFYLPAFDLAIEYQGEQHFRPICFFGGKEDFIARKKRDEIKKKFCDENDVDLHYINYDQDVTSELGSILQTLTA